MTAHAQAEVSPDHYELSNTEVTPALNAAIAGAKQTKADFTGKFSLPYSVRCNGQDLRPGEYLISVKARGTSQVVTIQETNTNLTFQARMVPANERMNGSTMIVRKSPKGRKLEGVYVAQLSSILYFQPVASAGSIERVPIS
jgi:hypothetical protein